MKLKLLLTFDHELPLGGVRTSYAEAMFEPTERLFRLADELEVPVVLFTDVLCAMKFREWDDSGFYQPYAEQLKQACKLGHDVQLHLHPHWLSSRFENNTFQPSGDYKLADFENHPQFPISVIIRQGIGLLNDICLPENPQYRCSAFRAGGYNLEGDRAAIFSALYQAGIRFDSSIIKGYYFRSGLSEIDFRSMPDAPNWFIGSNGNLREKAKDGILEVPIASIPKTPFEVPTRFKIRRLAHQAPINHGPMVHEGNPADLVSRLRMMFSARMLSFDNYTLSPAYLMKILDYNVMKYRKYDTVILSISGHPKSMGDYSFSLMKNFVSDARRKYPEVEFTSFSQLLTV